MKCKAIFNDRWMSDNWIVDGCCNRSHYWKIWKHTKASYYEKVMEKRIVDTCDNDIAFWRWMNSYRGWTRCMTSNMTICNHCNGIAKHPWMTGCKFTDGSKWCPLVEGCSVEYCNIVASGDFCTISILFCRNILMTYSMVTMTCCRMYAANVFLRNYCR